MNLRFKKMLSFLLALTLITTTVIFPVFANDLVTTPEPEAAVVAEEAPVEAPAEEPVTPPVEPAKPGVVINEVYGAGGNSGAIYINDFVELYNPTNQPIDLNGLSLQYAGGKATFSAANTMPLSGTIPAGECYLVQLAAGSNKTLKPLPKPDAIGSLSLGGSGGKVALVANTEAISGVADTDVIDFVGIGSVNEFEKAAAPAISSSTSAMRKVDGVDTNDNSADFIAGTPTPTNSVRNAITKCDMPTASKSAGVVDVQTEIVFSTLTEGATIEYNTVSATHDTWTAGSTVTLLEDTTYYVRAVKEGIESSDVATFAYTADKKLRITPNIDKPDAVSGATLVLTSNAATAKIYYTMDGSDVTTNSPLYTNGIKLEGNIGDKITVKALATAEGRIDSDVFVKEYTIKDPNDVMNVKEILALTTTTEDAEVRGTIAYFATAYGNPVIYSNVEGQNYALYIFGSAPDGAKIGDEIRLKGKYEVRYGMPQLSGLKTSVKIGEGIQIVPEEMTLADIKANGLKKLGQIVKIKGVTLGAEDSKSNTPVTDSTGTLNIYKATPFPVQVVPGDVVDLYAMIATFNTTVQLYTGTKAYNGYNIYDVTTDTKSPVVTFRDSYLSAKPDQDYTIGVTVEDNKGVADVKMTYTIGGKTVSDQPMTYVSENNEYRLVIPGNEITKEASSIGVIVKATDVTGLTTTSPAQSILIDAKPQFNQVVPSRGGSTGAVKNPLISVTLSNAGKSPVVTFSLAKEGTTLVDQKPMVLSGAEGVFTYQTETLEDGMYVATVTVVREDKISNTITWNFTVGEPNFRPYFGQLHAHTAEFSDGSGTLADGLSYIKNLPKSENVNFVSFTDHSNYFDTTTEPNPEAALNDVSKMTSASLEKWNRYVSTMDAFNNQNAGSILAFPGFEMTWSGGPGHINTFNSLGLVSRNNKNLNSKTADAGLKAYYDELVKNPEPLANLSQFNHPGKTFGTFADFAYWSPTIDNKMVAVEVGNGEGAIGSGGYFPSFAEYTKALDKGWHVAPTNNQDNHKGRWGNSNTGRTVIVTKDLSKEGLLKGLKEMSVYATEDHNLNIQYSVNNQMMGSIIAEVPTAPLQFNVVVDDPDASDMITKIDVVTNSGRIANTKVFDKNSVTWNFELPSAQGYYYLRVTQADKNIAVTAPVWIGQAPRVGINSVEASVNMPVTNEAFDLNTTVFNNEATPVTLKSIEYKLGDTVLHTDTKEVSLAATTSYKQTFNYLPKVAGKFKMTVTAVMIVEGQEKSFTQDIELHVRDSEKLVYVGIDASHYNEYVRGNYKNSMGNFANMAVGYDVRVVELETSEALIEATKNPKFKMMVLTPPTRRNGVNILMGYKNYTDEELAALKAFSESGKTIIVSGWSDIYESYTKYTDGTECKLPASDQMSAQQNKLLEAIGSTLRISDDGVNDAVTNGGSPYRLYLKNYNLENPFMTGIKPDEQVFSNYGGASIYAVDGEKKPTGTLPSSVSPMVYGFKDTESVDSDKDGTTGIEGVVVPKYNQLIMVAASENLGGNKGTVIVAGAAFMSNFEIQVTADSYATPAYSNYTILENVIRSVNPVVITPISEVHKVEEGVTFTIQGIATSNASGYDRNTAFFDTIYVQDGSAGIDVFPVAGNIRAGQTVQITGVTSSYNGERQLNVEKITVVDEAVKPLPTPVKVTTEQASKAAYLGSLVKVSGTITGLEYSNGVVESIFVKDSSNVATRVFIDGYITTTKAIPNLKVGVSITAVGLSSISTEGPRIRIRDRGDIVCQAASSGNESGAGDNQDTGKTDPKKPVVEPKADVTKVVGSVEGTQNEKGVASAMVDKALMDSMVKEVVKNENAKQAVVVEVVVPNTSDAKAVEVSINREMFGKLATETKAALKINAGIGSVELSEKAIDAVQSAAGKEDIVLKIEKRQLTEEALAHQDAYELTVMSGTKKIESFGEGEVLVNVPYAIKTGENPNAIVVYYIDLAGKRHTVLGNYDAVSKSVVFMTKHFSTYVVGYNDVKFKDVKASEWYYAAISNMAARKVVSGVELESFKPAQTVTRGEFMVMLMKAYGFEPSASKQDNFSDAGNTYYTAYLALAKELGITNGVGNNLFAPSKKLTKQEMLTMLYNTLKVMDKLPENQTQENGMSFKDKDQVSDFAKEAIERLAIGGFVKGNGGNINPKAYASRAESVQMFYNLLMLKTK